MQDPRNRIEITVHASYEHRQSDSPTLQMDENATYMRSDAELGDEPQGLVIAEK